MYDSFFSGLSGALNAALTAFETPEFLNTQNDLLTRLNLTQTLSSIEEMVDSLSSIPIHPYERLKFDYFDKDYVFKTIDDIPDVANLPIDKCIEFMRGKSRTLADTTFHNLTCSDDQRIDTAFHFLSGDQPVPDYSKQKNYIEFLELVRQIPIESVTPENSAAILRKITAEFVKVI